MTRRRVTPRALTQRAVLKTALFAVLVVALVTGAFWVFSGNVLDHPGPMIFYYAGKEYQLLTPVALGFLVATPVLLFGLRHSLADLPWQQAGLSLFFRIVFIALLALGLSRLVTTTESQKIATVLLVDVSDSVTDAAIEDARRQIAAFVHAKPKDAEVRLITFAERPRLESVRASLGQDSSGPSPGDGVIPDGTIPTVTELRHAPLSTGGVSGAPAVVATTDRPATGADPTQANNTPQTTAQRTSPSAGSNLQAAIELAYGVFPPGYLKRVVLFSDGVETEGDVLAEAHRAARFDVKLFSVPYRQPPPGEVAVVSLVVPDKVEIGQPFALRAEVYSSRATTARARLYQGEMLNGLDGAQQLELKPGANELTFKSVVRFGGEVTYALKLDQIADDKFSENNELAARLEVPGRPTVLYIEGQPARASYLTSALSAQQFDVDVRPVSAFPASLAEMERYDLFILSDVPAEQVSLSSQDLVERYVRDLGGGFVFAGGEA
ncbi:MAG: hypothetical protein RJA70_2976, partial [Pseudomonadota bacterium]